MDFIRKNQLVLLLVALIGVSAYAWYFFSGSGEEPTLQSSVPKTEAQLRFQSLVSELEPITFRTAIFSDPRFTSLVDLGVAVTPETSGRLDPFAPVGSSN